MRASKGNKCSKSDHSQALNHLYLFLPEQCVQATASSKKMSQLTSRKSFCFFCKDNLFTNQGYYQSSQWCKEREQTSTSTILTLGYGYCFPLGYNAPVNRGIIMLGTNESFIIRKASLSPSGDHQWAI